jgi:hypothetical protein
MLPILRETTNLAALEKVGLCREMCPVSSCHGYQAVTIKAELFSDAEEEEYPGRITFPVIKAEPENAVDFGKARVLHSEIWQASHDAYLAVSIKAEVLSDAAEEEYPVPLTCVGMKGEPKMYMVRSGHVPMMSVILQTNM